MSAQDLFDQLSAGWRAQRSLSQMTLEKLINRLDDFDDDFEITGLGELGSYRGYYADLAFEPTLRKVKVRHLKKQCEQAIGDVYRGYKGGEYTMDKNTPLWYAYYGECGQKLMGIKEDGSIEIEEEE